jgi:hypothetical protein
MGTALLLLLVGCGGPQNFRVFGDASAKRATVLVDGAVVGALSDTTLTPYVDFLIPPGEHRISVISVQGDTLSCTVITKDHELVIVSFRDHEILPQYRNG